MAQAKPLLLGVVPHALEVTKQTTEQVLSPLLASPSSELPQPTDSSQVPPLKLTASICF